MDKEKVEFETILEHIDSIPEASVYTEPHESLQELLSELDAIVPGVLQSYSIPIYKTIAQTPSEAPVGELEVEVKESYWEDKPCYEVHLHLTSTQLPRFHVHSWVSPQLVTWHESYENEAQGTHQTIWYHQERYFIKDETWVQSSFNLLLFQGAVWVLSSILLQTDTSNTFKEVFMYTTYAKHEMQLVSITVIPTSYPIGVGGPWLGLHFDPPQLCQQMYRPKKNKSNASLVLFHVFQVYIACQKHNFLSPKSFTTSGPTDSHEEFGLEFQSIFYDLKDSDKQQIESYLKSHPELIHLVSEWMKSVLTVKPENIFEHAKNYFDLS